MSADTIEAVPTISVRELYDLERLCGSLLHIRNETMTTLIDVADLEALERIQKLSRVLHHYDFQLPEFVRPD